MRSVRSFDRLTRNDQWSMMNDGEISKIQTSNSFDSNLPVLHTPLQMAQQTNDYKDNQCCGNVLDIMCYDNNCMNHSERMIR
jgi:hypothetical protein